MAATDVWKNAVLPDTSFFHEMSTSLLRIRITVCISIENGIPSDVNIPYLLLNLENILAHLDVWQS